MRLGACTDASLPMHARRARQDGDTALIWANQEGHLEVVNALLGKGAEKEAKNKVMWCGRFCESRVCTARKHAPPHASSGSDCWEGGVGVVCSGERGAPTGVVRLGACTDASLPMHA